MIVNKCAKFHFRSLIQEKVMERDGIPIRIRDQLKNSYRVNQLLENNWTIIRKKELFILINRKFWEKICCVLWAPYTACMLKIYLSAFDILQNTKHQGKSRYKQSKSNPDFNSLLKGLADVLFADFQRCDCLVFNNLQLFCLRSLSLQDYMVEKAV